MLREHSYTEPGEGAELGEGAEVGEGSEPGALPVGGRFSEQRAFGQGPFPGQGPLPGQGPSPRQGAFPGPSGLAKPHAHVHTSPFAPSAPPYEESKYPADIDEWCRRNEIPVEYQRSLFNFAKNSATFDIVFVVDNSSSMANFIDPGKTLRRWEELCQRVSELSELLFILKMSFTLHFMNYPKTIVGVPRVEQIVRFNVQEFKSSATLSNEIIMIFHSCSPDGLTPITETLETVWREHRGGKRLIVIVATDGQPQPDKIIPEGERTDYHIQELYDFLDRKRDAKEMAVTFMACTEDHKVMQYLNDWDNREDEYGGPALKFFDVVDDYKSEEEEYLNAQILKGVVYPVGLSPGLYILKTLLGSVDPEIGRIDKIPSRKSVSRGCSIL